MECFDKITQVLNEKLLTTNKTIRIETNAP